MNATLIKEHADEAFAQTHCMVPHYVYLAVSSGLKVGLTRKGNQMKRWTDQGAVQAIPIAELPTRKLAGELEFELSKHVMDKTDWRKMLKGEVSEIELLQSRDEILAHVPEAFKPYLLDDTKVFEFLYPQLEPVQKIKTYDLDKSPVITDRLIGIKGSYLMFGQAVMNVKKSSADTEYPYRAALSRRRSNIPDTPESQKHDTPEPGCIVLFIILPAPIP